jgi:molybdopterin-containing oxidoreductase family iron-sulfur binding subunit
MGKPREQRHWRSLEERDDPGPLEAAARDEFLEPPPAGNVEFGRRGFLRAAGFAFAGAAMTGCHRAPVEKAIPYLVKPEEITPGRSYFYASTCGACPAACGMLVKTRDGRPIKLEGNPDHPLSRGRLCAVGQASILGLYDSQRLNQPLARGEESNWSEVDGAIIEQLAAIRERGGAVRFLTETIHSPTLLASIEQFLSGFDDARHVVYDPLSSSALLDACAQTHGARTLPRFRFEKSKVIVSFDADFLGVWISPVEHTAGYRAARNIEVGGAHDAYHVQFESRMSLTGTKADQRIRVAPRELGLIATHLAALLAGLAGVPFETTGLESSPVPESALKTIADRLWGARGESLVVCGSQDVAAQTVCNFINHILGNEGSTAEFASGSFQRRGNDRETENLLSEIAAGQVGALFVAGVNPAFDLPGGGELADRLKSVPLLVSLSQRLDETALLANYVCPDTHSLECWSDSEPAAGVVGLAQPCVRPLGAARPVVESLAAWQGETRSSYDIHRASWERSLFPLQTREASFQTFWDSAVHDGVVQVDRPNSSAAQEFRVESVKPVLTAAPVPNSDFEIVLYPKTAMHDGRHAYNPWLQELPDPVTKVTWDNYACLSPAAAASLSVSDGDVVSIDTAGDAAPSASLELPVVIQPGQHDRVVAVALGYGSVLSKRFSKVGPQWFEARGTLGPNGLAGAAASPLLRIENGAIQYSGAPVRVEPAGRRRALASTQTHHTITVPEHLAPPGGEHRPVIQETTLAALQSPSPDATHANGHHELSMWPDEHHYPGRRWAMAIDLDACTGCSACVVACQVENNVPVVGRDEVFRRREMHWIRIDRYYSGDGDDLEAAHQPMLCQHCENAPCETVCPVLATVHSEEGLNQQIYNRCVGTRYCANNCPYKVRRFNWFDYAHENPRENLVLNPDVTVRSRGVMEKCSLCVQRIQEAKIEARRLGKPLGDGDVRTACQQTCPADAIVFGDRNDPASRIAQVAENPRRYGVLEEINVRPAISYLKIVRRGPSGEEKESHG